ncbi:MAG: hypothetical protein IH607_06685 [Firmicutes bacterium]|nr:hypothetical protein [Bacillota bacterium]
MQEYVVDTSRQYDEKGKLYYMVHLFPKTNCPDPDYPKLDNQRRLSKLESCKEALARAEALGYKKAVPCPLCCKESQKK